MDLPFPASYQDAKNGGKILLTPDSYEYSVSKTEEKRTHCVCLMKTKYKCRVTAAVARDTDMVVRVSGEHNHDTDLSKKLGTEMRDEAVKAATSLPTVVPRTVTANLTNTMLVSAPDAIASLPKAKSIARYVTLSQYLISKHYKE